MRGVVKLGYPRHINSGRRTLPCLLEVMLYTLIIRHRPLSLLNSRPHPSMARSHENQSSRPKTDSVTAVGAGVGKPQLSGTDSDDYCTDATNPAMAFAEINDKRR